MIQIPNLQIEQRDGVWWIVGLEADQDHDELEDNENGRLTSGDKPSGQKVKAFTYHDSRHMRNGTAASHAR